MYPLEIPTLFKKGLSVAIFSLILIFFFGLVNIEHALLGIPEPVFQITEEIKTTFDIIFWIIVGLFILELLVAYLEIRHIRTFLRKYWLESVLLALMLTFGGFEILNISLAVLDKIKISKTAFKILKISVALLDQIKLSRSGYYKISYKKI